MPEQPLLQLVSHTNMACGDEHVPGIIRLSAEMHDIRLYFRTTCQQSDDGGLVVGGMFRMDYDAANSIFQANLWQIHDSSWCYLFVNLWVSVLAWLPDVAQGENVDLSAVPNSIRQLIGYEQCILTWNEYITIQETLNYYRVVLVELETPLRDVWTAISHAEGWNPIFHPGYFSTPMSLVEVHEDCTVEEFCVCAGEYDEPYFPCVEWPNSVHDTGAPPSNASSQTAETEEMFDEEMFDEEVDDTTDAWFAILWKNVI